MVDVEVITDRGITTGIVLVQMLSVTGMASYISKQMGKRGWTEGGITEAMKSGKQIKAKNKATGNPATRYVHPRTGQSVVIDDVTGEVIHVGGPGFDYGPESGDLK